MYLERLFPENVRHLAAVEQVFSDGPQQIRRWTLLSAGAAATAQLRCLALISLGRWQMSRLAERVLPLLAAKPDRPVRMEYVLIRHAPQERLPHSASRYHQGWRILAGGKWEALARQALRCQAPGAPPRAVESGRSQTGRLLLGYGRSIQVGTDGFDFYPDQRWRRCAGLFEAESRVTDPVAFLKRLHYKSKYRRGRARAVLNWLKDGLSDWLGWDVVQSLERGTIEAQWESTPRARQVPMMVVLDIARHAFDTASRLGEADPLRQTGVVLFERIGAWCPAGQLATFVRLLDGWFPNLQFILALHAGARRHFPRRLLPQRLPIPEPQPRQAPTAPRRLPRGAVLLVDVDSQLPNLALMKLSRHFKAQGHVVCLSRGVSSMPPAETVLASCVFNLPASARRLEALRRHYGSAVQLGGSGVDLRLRLEPEIEALAPDYTLYPELGDRALGFLTRGCRFHCSFCVVPIKEGAPRQVSDLDGLLQGRRKLILLDDNLLAHPDALRLIEDMVRRGLAVNFNQTLDLRLLTPEAAALLRRMDCANSTFIRRNLYFSLNDARHLDLMRERYDLL
ncbi:MAG: radical SAM protein, partial [Verrucomicrobia bacterium]|nr:radical SAM protein [Verrucomicrobiota bacterium]